MINVFQPSLGKEELNALEKVFESNWLGKGKLTHNFEEKFSEHLGVPANLIRSTNCCSEGLFLSMSMFDIQKGDEVIMPTISFVGAGNAVCHAGAKLVLCDVDSRTLNVRAEDIEKKITKNTKAVMLIHYGGVPCEMDEIMDMANSYGIKVIEDSACSIYSKYKGRACGTIGDMGMWSLDAMKILVCGDGAMLYFKDPDMALRAEKEMYFGLESKSGFSNSVDSKWWEFEISSYGHRSVMNDMTASVGLEQLTKLPKFIARRKEIHDMYDEQLKDVSWLQIPEKEKEGNQYTYYFYHIQLLNNKRDQLAKYLRDNGIYTTFRYFPLHWVKYYGVNEILPNAEKAALNTLCIPIHQSLSNEDVEKIIYHIKKFGEINGL